MCVTLMLYTVTVYSSFQQISKFLYQILSLNTVLLYVAHNNAFEIFRNNLKWKYSNYKRT